MSRFLITLAALAFACIACAALAEPAADEIAKRYSYEQSEAADTPAVAANNDAAENVSKLFFERDRNNRLIETTNLLIIGIVALLALTMATRTIARTSRNPGWHTVNVTGIVMIAFGTVSLCLVAVSETQLTAAVGVLGGLSGYLFGTNKPSTTASTEAQAKPMGTPEPITDPR